jgi:hypothetical protein
MVFEKFEGPWNGVELLGCRDLFCGERLILDLFEYLQSGPDEDIKRGAETISGTHTIGLIAESRIWRLTFDPPFALKVRGHDLKLRHEATNNFPGRCCYSERSTWIDEFTFDQHLAFFTPTHYVFNLIDNFVEILGDSSPTVEEIPNELTVDES